MNICIACDGIGYFENEINLPKPRKDKKPRITKEKVIENLTNDKDILSFLIGKNKITCNRICYYCNGKKIKKFHQDPEFKGEKLLVHSIIGTAVNDAHVKISSSNTSSEDINSARRFLNNERGLFKLYCNLIELDHIWVKKNISNPKNVNEFLDKRLACVRKS